MGLRAWYHGVCRAGKRDEKICVTYKRRYGVLPQGFPLAHFRITSYNLRRTLNLISNAQTSPEMSIKVQPPFLRAIFCLRIGLII